MMSSNVLFCPQSKDDQFTVIEEERNQEVVTFKKLESGIWTSLFLKNYSNDSIIDYHNSWRLIETTN